MTLTEIIDGDNFFASYFLIGFSERKKTTNTSMLFRCLKFRLEIKLDRFMVQA